MKLLEILKKKKIVKADLPAETGRAEKTEKPTEEKRNFSEGLVSTKDIIAPGSLEVDIDFIRIEERFYRTLFVAGYPRFVGMNWLSPLINFDASLTVAMYIYPSDGKAILDDLRRKIAEMEAEISTDAQRGKVVNPATQAKLEDALTLQADLVRGEERYFQFGLYVTITAETREDLNRINKNLEAALGALMIISKKATWAMEDGFITTLPVCANRLDATSNRNMDTTSLATTFPFVSSDLSDDRGIMYGINEHNGSLVIFDRFSMQNYNSVVFATAGAGKSYLIKLEALRSLMMGTEIIVVDPENEYKDLCEAVGGQYIAFGYGEASKINPFDLSLTQEEGENALNEKVLSLHKLFKIMMGEMDPIEESVLDRAIMDAYKMKGISPDAETQTKEAPLIEDLYKSLIGMESKEAQGLAARLEKYIKGSFAGIFNQKTTVNLNNKLVVFGIRNLEETLRPVAMHIILDYIWTVVRKRMAKRILIVDEAWYLMQFADSAAFLRGIVKRGRKYYLGVTTITQDVDDFLETPYGKEIVTNSAIQILLKQHSAAIDKVGEIFYLSEGEKQLLLTAEKGEGIFFAGQNHVAIRVIASEDEHKLITSNPEEIMKSKLKTQSLNIKTVTQNPKPLIPETKTGTVIKAEGPGNVKSQISPPKADQYVAENIKTSTQSLNPVTRQITSSPDLNPEKPKGETVVEPTAEEMLLRRIQEMEKKAQEEIRKHQEEKLIPTKQDLFKATVTEFKPLPKLPKFNLPLTPVPKPIVDGGGQSKPLAEIKPVIEEKKNEDKVKFETWFKPEPKIPQPMQLQKKKIEFETKSGSNQGQSQGQAVVSDQNNKKQPLNYDKLFGNN